MKTSFPFVSVSTASNFHILHEFQIKFHFNYSKNLLLMFDQYTLCIINKHFHNSKHTKEATILPKMKGNKISKLIIPKNLRTTYHEYTAIFTEHGGLSLPSKNIDKGA